MRYYLLEYTPAEDPNDQDSILCVTRNGKLVTMANKKGRNGTWTIKNKGLELTAFQNIKKSQANAAMILFEATERESPSQKPGSTV